MPKRTDIESILVIGAGPIIIGQACEFDYSGTQACKVLKQEGYRVILINSNPATIMTDPKLADATYIEPILPSIIEKIIIKEKPNAILATVGGQTSLNVAIELSDQGILSKYNVQLIGANHNTIKKAEDRNLFCQSMDNIGIKYPKRITIKSIEMITDAIEYIGLPAVIRPSFTLGGIGGGIAYNKDEFYSIVKHGLSMSPISEVQVDESIIGWKEFEMEVMRDSRDNCIVVCSIENIDPMGVHTGDSITVAPAITLRDEEYQKMRSMSFAVLREIGVETGGSNVQFAINPKKEGEILVIEMNPRVSRSSALASKATGFPIAKVAAKLAIGYTLNEIMNDCTPNIPASFEPTMDYIVVKIPRFNFDKFQDSNKELSTTMKSVGEVMAIGRSFTESLQKALCSLEIGLNGLNEFFDNNVSTDQIYESLVKLSPDRILIIADALRHNISIDKINKITGYDPWFLMQIQNIIKYEKIIKNNGIPTNRLDLIHLKKMGFSDSRLAELSNNTIDYVEHLRDSLSVKPVYKRIDTCAGEFEAKTVYMYSCYEESILSPPECEANVTEKNKIIILGSGPNRIGQGIEFDYTCVHAAYTIKQMGYEAIIINCNPETVSTDYDTSDRLYFSPLTRENILDIIYKEQEKGASVHVIVQFGGQTPLKLAKILKEKSINIIGTSFDSIDLAEDRMKFQQLLTQLNLKQPSSMACNSIEETMLNVKKIAFPLLLRPSYVLGGQFMSIIHDINGLLSYLEKHKNIFHHGSLLIDSFLTNAVEVDVDAICDGENVYIAAIMEHIEEAGIHSGDSACSIPPYTLHQEIIDKIVEYTKKVSLALKVKGLINIQYAIQKQEIYILEVNPRASRTIPFIAKATGIPVAKIATEIMLGKKLCINENNTNINYVAIKEAVFSFSRFPNSDVLLGPEMKSTGEVMGIDESFEIAFAKSQMAAGYEIPTQGKAFISVKDNDKPEAAKIAQILLDIGFEILSTTGTSKYFDNLQIKNQHVNKVRDGRPHIIDMLQDGKISLVINTSEGLKSTSESSSIRTTALFKKIPYSTTISGAKALAIAIKHFKMQGLCVKPIQEYFNNKNINIVE
ncbi:carbamoyl-phosphate synthase large subunit [Neoehrlichia mikurensis]|uniref:Carbamoyl phosphate synthase large chain n=1 Tax=Neoehrlichia mikurensis TaxID=89586 RepID=A0A9Q9BZS1_9RICK|nr:carbamoyl-phosphate synthase large subunit [Neoehrlichia mikurensis]QXK91771.1 carbamoyl-phosphate synthase large subunit [Neoehrlichia mikurensis]QXK92984.1 carbamoyl-phosphate synthase large subunit [Neoehrlichia mikurensis]QXK93461.1 carbamoyl-phosphate synthase large subunit [Neoehrlichia mikurensis]UTO55584.1 carbamoyl-phosphate synthase large subunit [Neoehrlichia mikurensis]UTO56505.1 carbamoyl-phosphate synthase large subunit [Neoehrlichia mikurensis]